MLRQIKIAFTCALVYLCQSFLLSFFSFFYTVHLEYEGDFVSIFFFINKDHRSVRRTNIFYKRHVQN